MYFRLSEGGYHLSTLPRWHATHKHPEQLHGKLGEFDRSLSNINGHIGPYPGDMARSSVGLVMSKEVFNDFGDRPAGLGRSWERLHMIGVSAGNLDERRYSNFNTLIGSHALNTAMIPFERIVNWVIAQQRIFKYSVKILTHKALRFKDIDGTKRQEDVPLQMKQIISYTSEQDENVWITISQDHTDWRVNKLDSNNEIAYKREIEPEDYMMTSNFTDVHKKIARIDSEVIMCQKGKAKWGFLNVF